MPHTISDVISSISSISSTSSTDVKFAKTLYSETFSVLCYVLTLTWDIHTFFTFGREDTAIVPGFFCIEICLLVYLRINHEVV